MKYDKENEQLKSRVQKLEQERKESTAKLAELYRLNDAHHKSIGLAHEINNPLNNIQTTINILLDENLPDDIKKELQQIQCDADRINLLIENQKQAVQHRETHLIPLNLKEILLKVFENYQQRLSIRKIYYNVQQLPDDLPLINADPVDLDTIFSNLITNARDALEKTSNPEITLNIELSPQHLILTFSDNGSGIDKSVLPKIFDPLFTTKTKQGGLGIGLWNCKNLLAKMNATIDIKSQLNQGTTFILTFPLLMEKNK